MNCTLKVGYENFWVQFKVLGAFLGGLSFAVDGENVSFGIVRDFAYFQASEP